MTIEAFLAALRIVFDTPVLLAIFGGAIYGVVIGAIPGLTATMATALLVPLTFYMDPIPAIALIVSTTAMAITSGDIPGALLRIPGTPASAAYVEESYAMTLNGNAETALSIGIFFSAIGGLFGATVLMVSGPLLARVALRFSSFEFFWLALLGLMTSALVSARDPARGFASLLLGLLISTVGLDITSGQPRVYLRFNRTLWRGKFHSHDDRNVCAGGGAARIFGLGKLPACAGYIARRAIPRHVEADPEVSLVTVARRDTWHRRGRSARRRR